MTETSPLSKLFKPGMTKEQFIDKYNELKAKSKGDKKSIFKDEFAGSIGQVYDLINANKDDKIDEDEIKNLAGNDTSDGENVLSEADMLKVYQELVKQQNATSEYRYNPDTETESADGVQQQQKAIKYSSNKPEDMYNDVVTKGGQENGSYIESLSSQIDSLEAMATERQNVSDMRLNNLQSQMDDLVMRSSELSTSFKSEYKDLSKKVQKAKQKAEKCRTELNELKTKIDNTDNDIQSLKSDIETDTDEKTKAKKQKQLEKLQNKYRDYHESYQETSSEMDSYNQSQQNESAKLSDLTTQNTSDKSDLSSRINTIKSNMAAERASAKQDLSSYRQQISVLQNAQNYALSQMQPSDDGVSENYSDEDTSKFSYDAKELKAKWQKKFPKKVSKLSDAFFNKTVEISKRIGCDPNALMAVMYSESGLNSKAGNSNGGATGLIQFMPSTAKALGTTTAKLRAMSPEEQLNYVEKCFLSSKKYAGFKSSDKLDAGTLYALIFLPGYAKRKVLTTKGHKFYNYNAGLDTNKDGQITKADLSARIHKFMA